MTKADFDDWRRADMTKMFLSAVTQYRYDTLQLLLTTDTLEDMKHRQGYIAALTDVLNLDLDLNLTGE